MARTTVIALALLVATTVPLWAQDNDGAKPIGTWTRTATVRHHEMRVKMEVKADTLRCTVRLPDEPLPGKFTADADYVITRDGRVLGAVPLGHREKKAGNKESSKDQRLDRVFVCRFKVEKHALVISDLVWGGKDGDTIKEVIEGTYRKAEGATSAVRVSPLDFSARCGEVFS
jgi:hypothetical protein